MLTSPISPWYSGLSLRVRLTYQRTNFGRARRAATRTTAMNSARIPRTRHHERRFFLGVFAPSAGFSSVFDTMTLPQSKGKRANGAPLESLRVLIDLKSQFAIVPRPDEPVRVRFWLLV